MKYLIFLMIGAISTPAFADFLLGIDHKEREIPVEHIYTHLKIDQIHETKNMTEFDFKDFAIIVNPRFELDRRVGDVDVIRFDHSYKTMNQLCKVLGYEGAWGLKTVKKYDDSHDHALVYWEEDRQAFVYHWDKKSYSDEASMAYGCSFDSALLGEESMLKHSVPKTVHNLNFTVERIDRVYDFPGYDEISVMVQPRLLVSPAMPGFYEPSYRSTPVTVSEIPMRRMSSVLCGYIHKKFEKIEGMATYESVSDTVVTLGNYNSDGDTYFALHSTSNDEVTRAATIPCIN